MATTSPRLLSRLHRDLAELQEQPYPGVAVFIDDADVRKFCLVLTPPAGPWKALALHFDVVLPPSWPSHPPSVSSSVHGIDHPNLFGGYICCDLLKPMDWLERGYNGGYTPALTLRGLFLQFLTFFSSTSVEQDYGGSVEIGDAMLSSYMLEKDIALTQYPRQKCCRHQYECPCHSLHQRQPELERKWRADSGKETTISTYISIDGPVTHKAKGAAPHPDRIHVFEKRNPRWQSTLDLIKTWTCRRCPYGSASLTHQTPTAAMDVAAGQIPLHFPSTCFLHLLDDDVLLEIASRMPSEDLITFGHAYSRFHSLVSRHHIFLLRELHCFFLRKHLHGGILGIGVSFEAGPRILASDFDWLSLEAFDQHNVRRSIQKREFQFFLPLAFNEAHFADAKEEIWKRVGIIYQAGCHAETNRQTNGSSGRGRGQGRSAPRSSPSSAPAPTLPHHRFNIVFKMMNNIVVSLMKSCDDALTTSWRSSSSPNFLQASEKAVISYCHLMHLLIRISASHPPFLQSSLARVLSFLQSPANRTKEATPDMGELIVAITLVLFMFPAENSTVPTWSTLSGPFLEEAITRNVRWVLKGAPELEIMEDGASDYRLTTTFSKSKTSLRLIMFQITFLNLFIRTYHGTGIHLGHINSQLC